MISRTARYALRVLRFLAGKPKERVRGREIARTAGVPTEYLAKIMGRLSREGFVEGKKGWGGGFVLTAKGARRPLLDVIELFDGLPDPHACFFGLRPCNDRDPCPLHGHWDRLRDDFRAMLRSTRVGELAGSDGRR